MFIPHELLSKKSEQSFIKESRLVKVTEDDRPLGEREQCPTEGVLREVIYAQATGLRSPYAVVGKLHYMLTDLSIEDEGFEQKVDDIFAQAHKVHAFCYSIVQRLRSSGGDETRIKQLEHLLEDLDDFLCLEAIDTRDKKYVKEAYSTADELVALIQSADGFDETNPEHIGLVDKVRGVYSHIFARALMYKVNSVVGVENGFLTGPALYKALNEELAKSLDAEGIYTTSESLIREVLDLADDSGEFTDSLMPWELMSLTPDPTYGVGPLRLYRYFERHGSLRPTLGEFQGHMVQRFVKSFFDRDSETGVVKLLASEVRHMKGQIRTLLLDRLTRLPKGEVWDEKMAQLEGRKNKPYTLISVDLVGFKRFNDVAEYEGLTGHDVGDQALAAVGRAFASVQMRDGDLVARKGGEEFAVYMEGDVPKEIVISKLREFDDALRQVNTEEAFVYAKGHPQAGQKIDLAASFGVEKFDQALHDRVPKEVWQGADNAMYLNKHFADKTPRDFADRRAIAFGPSYGGGRVDFEGNLIVDDEPVKTARSRMSQATDGLIQGGKTLARHALGNERYKTGRVMGAARGFRDRVRGLLG